MIDEIVYDDSFKVGLEKLFKDHSPNSMPRVREILDDNGYIGRNSPVQLYKLGHKTYDVRVKVLLVYGGWQYTWPHNGVYNLNSNKVVYKSKPILFDGWVTNIIDKGVRYISADPYALASLSNIPMNKVAKTLEGLIETGVIQGGKFKLSRYHPLETEEFIQNMLKFK